MYPLCKRGGWSIIVVALCAVAGIQQCGKHQPTAEFECVGEYLRFDESIHLINAVVIFFKHFSLLVCHGITEPIPVAPHMAQQFFDCSIVFLALFLRIYIPISKFFKYVHSAPPS